MDFSLTSEQKELQSVAREFAQKEMTSVAKELEEKKEFLSVEWFDRYAEMGFLGLNINKKYGGLGLSNIDALLVLEEFAKVSSVVAWPILESAVGPIKAIEHFADEDLKLRGPGEFFGTKQHGYLKTKIVNFLKDQHIIRDTKNIAFQIIKNDPNLSKKNHQSIKQELLKNYSNMLAFLNIN